ncbi:MAG: glycine betaine/L-proline ABC transporter substrate-binding protein ProX [Cyanobacteria bacterium J06650_10]
MTTTMRPSFAAWTRLLIATVVVSLSACSGTPPDAPKNARPLRPGYGTLEELFQTEIVNIGLEELGYEVVPGSETEYDIIHEAIAKGFLDFTTAHWNYNHADFLEQNGGDSNLVRAGTLIEDVLQGYVIDSATAKKYNITSLEQLQDPEIAALFDSDEDGKANLVGCIVGWGCHDVTEHHLEAYGLKDTVEHDSSNYFGLIEGVIQAHQAQKPVLYYTWTPFWLNFILVPGEDVEWLSVPYTDLPSAQGRDVPTVYEGKNLGFAINEMDILANKDFLEAHSKARKFFEVVTVPNEAVSLQNQKMREGENTPAQIRRHAEEWVIDNQSLFDSWVKAAR